MTTPSDPSTALSTLRVTAGALVTTPLFILLAVSFVLPRDDGTAPMWAFGAVAMVALAATSVVTTVGYRTAAIAPGTPEDQARATSLAALTSTTLLRCALTEAIAILGLALAFVVPQGGLVLCIAAAATSVVLSILFSFPSDRIVGRIRESLEREGGRSGI